MQSHDEDAIRAENGVHHTEAETKRFEDKSRGKRPACGNCTVCHKCGQVGVMCDECNSRNIGHSVAKALHPVASKDMITDAEHLAEVFGKGQVIAKADRAFGWLQEPMKTMEWAQLIAETFVLDPSKTHQVERELLNETVSVGQQECVARQNSNSTAEN